MKHIDEADYLYDINTPSPEDASLSLEEIEEISSLSKRGYQLLKENLTSQARDHFMRILERYPTNNYALVGLGDVSRKQRLFREALRYYTTCLDHFPGNSYALFGMASCYKELNNLPAAIDAWEQYSESDPTNIAVLTRIGDAYRKLKDFQRSKAAYLRALATDPHNAYALIGLGHLCFDFQEFESAISYWEAVYDHDPESVDIRVLTSIGNCHRKLKTFERGKRYFLKALDIDQKNFFALFGMADCHRGLMEYEQSLVYWLRILQFDPHNKVILTRAGDAFRALGRFEEAKKYYQQALDIGFDSYAMLGLAMIHKQQHEYREAIENMEALIEKDPRNHRLYTEAANCYLEQGDTKSALRILNRFEQLGIHNMYVSSLINKIESGL